MHVGEKPYVVTKSGPAELAANALTVPAMTGMLNQLLPADLRQTLKELGAVEYHLPRDDAAAGMRYSVVAARGGADIWIEVRRWKEEVRPPVVVTKPVTVAVEAMQEPARVGVEEVQPVAIEERVVLEERATTAPQAQIAEAEIRPAETPAAVEVPGDGFEQAAQTEDELQRNAEPEPELVSAVVVPLTRVHARFEPPPPLPRTSARQRAVARADPLRHLLQVASSQSASALYVAAGAKPCLRVDGEIRVLHELPLTEVQLEAELKALLVPRASGATGEVDTCEVSGVGRVQCLRFRDHRGLGVLFKVPGRAISAEQVGLPASIKALCAEPEGLLLLAGAPGAGKSTLVATLVDQINRTRRDHVITVERTIQFVHENHASFISQRGAREDHRFADAVRAAMREAPDVLVIDGVMNSDIAGTALEAAANGHLVLATMTAPSTAGALTAFVALFEDHAQQARATLAEHLRGVVMQALLRKSGGGRAAAREVFLNLPSVSALVASGQFDLLTTVLNSGRHVGMVPLNDALLTLVRNGALDAREAYRKSPDQRELVAMLNRASIDTAFAEKLA